MNNTLLLSDNFLVRGKSAFYPPGTLVAGRCCSMNWNERALVLQDEESDERRATLARCTCCCPQCGPYKKITSYINFFTSERLISSFAITYTTRLIGETDVWRRATWRQCCSWWDAADLSSFLPTESLLPCKLHCQIHISSLIQKVNFCNIVTLDLLVKIIIDPTIAHVGEQFGETRGCNFTDPAV